MFATGSMIKNRKINNIEYLIKQVHQLYLQQGFKSFIYMLIAILNLYEQIFLILVYP